MSRVHEPDCNVYCDERGHYLLPSGPQGETFSHQVTEPVAAASPTPEDGKPE